MMLLNPLGRCFQGTLSGTQSLMTLSEFEALDTCYSASATPAPTTPAPTTPAPSTPAPTTPAPTTPAPTTPVLTIQDGVQVFQGSLDTNSTGNPYTNETAFGLLAFKLFPGLSVNVIEVSPSIGNIQTLCFAIQPLDANNTFEGVMGTLEGFSEPVSWSIPPSPVCCCPVQRIS